MPRGVRGSGPYARAKVDDNGHKGEDNPLHETKRATSPVAAFVRRPAGYRLTIVDPDGELVLEARGGPAEIAAVAGVAEHIMMAKVPVPAANGD